MEAKEAKLQARQRPWLRKHGDAATAGASAALWQLAFGFVRQASTPVAERLRRVPPHKAGLLALGEYRSLLAKRGRGVGGGRESEGENAQ